jgi:hypothetical protein
MKMLLATSELHPFSKTGGSGVATLESGGQGIGPGTCLNMTRTGQPILTSGHGHGEAVPAISRGSRSTATTPPEIRPEPSRILKGCQRRFERLRPLAPLRGATFVSPAFRGCRSAQPPATVWQPSGLRPPAGQASSLSPKSDGAHSSTTVRDREAVRFDRRPTSQTGSLSSASSERSASSAVKSSPSSSPNTAP